MSDGLRISLTMHLRGNHYPPLPLEYVDWVVELLPEMQAAATSEERFGDGSGWDEMVRIPDAVMGTGIVPKNNKTQEDGTYVRLGDMMKAMHLSGYLEHEEGWE